MANPDALTLTPEHIAAAFDRLVLAGCHRAFGRETPTPEQKIAEWELYVAVLGREVTPAMLACAVVAYLRDPKCARIWPTAADLRARALEFRPQAPYRAPDPDTAYATARQYVVGRGEQYWPGAHVLRTWLADNGIEREAMAERIAAAGDTYLARHLPGFLKGRSCPRGPSEIAALAKHFPADLVERAANRSPWATLQEEHEAPIAKAAEVAGNWRRWVLLTYEEEPAHRKAFRDAYAALLARQETDRRNEEAVQLLAGLGAGLLAFPGATSARRQLVDGGEPRPLLDEPAGRPRERVPLHVVGRGKESTAR